MSGRSLEFGAGSKASDVAKLGLNYLAGAKASGPASGTGTFHVTSACISRLGSGIGSMIGVGYDYALGNGRGSHTTLLEVRPPEGFRSWWDTDEMRNSRDRSETSVHLAKDTRFKTFDDLLTNLDAESGFDFVAESYWENPQERAVPPGVHPLRSVLATYLTSRQTWWRSGKTFMFQRKRWWDERQSEIPDGLWKQVELWIKSGLRSLEDWSRLAVLADPQWPRLQSLREMGLEQEYLPEFKLYHDLSESERLIAQGRGISAKASQGKLAKAIYSWLGRRIDMGELDSQDASDYIIQIRVDGGSTAFRALAVRSEGTLPVVSRVVPVLPAAALATKKSNSHSDPR